MPLSLSLAPPPSPPEEPDRKITLTLPATVIRELKRRVATDDTTMRALILAALAQAGYSVATEELRDRRRR